MRAGDRHRQADPGRPADQPGRHLPGQPAAAARRRRRGDRRDRHGAVRPPRDHDAAADRQVRRLQRELDEARASNWRAQRRPKYTFASFIGSQPGGAGSQAPGAPRGADRQHRAAAGRNRHRQGTAGARHPRRQRARRASRSSASTSRRCPTRCSRPSSSASRPAPTPAPTARAATASSSSPTAARCSSTRSATCRWRCRQAAARAAGAGDRAAGQQPGAALDVRVIAATSRDLPAMVARRHASAPTCTTA